MVIEDVPIYLEFYLEHQRGLKRVESFQWPNSSPYILNMSENFIKFYETGTPGIRKLLLPPYRPKYNSYEAIGIVFKKDTIIWVCLENSWESKF